MKIKGLIFDLDGVLVDTKKIHFNAYFTAKYPTVLNVLIKPMKNAKHVSQDMFLKIINVNMNVRQQIAKNAQRKQKTFVFNAMKIMNESTINVI